MVINRKYVASELVDAHGVSQSEKWKVGSLRNRKEGRMELQLLAMYLVGCRDL